MSPPVRTGRRACVLPGLVLVCLMPADAAANLWQATFGQNYFYESVGRAGQALAGTHSEALLQPGQRYRISFQVRQLRGALRLAVGERTIIIDRRGRHAYDFAVWPGSKRRLLFSARGQDVSASVTGINVRPHSGARQARGAPGGHYLSFARERDLERVMAHVDDPRRAPSAWHLGMARKVHDALTTPGIRGFSMTVDWRSLEVADGRYDWRLLDANMAVARRLGLDFVVQVGTRGYAGDDVTPRYFPGRYRAWTRGGGHQGMVAKLWEPWVSTRLIRLHKRIARRYAGDAAFGGIATTETAVGNVRNGYSVAAYREALERVVAQTQQALTRGRLFWYLNFVRGGHHPDMRKDMRVQLANRVPHHSLVVGAPDVTPDRPGMPGSVSSVRIHLRKTQPHVEQFCHLQHVDQGLGGINRKSNQQRRAFLEQVRRTRQRERRPWFQGVPAVFRFDDLRTAGGRRVELHPRGVVGQLWQPDELFRYARRNFDCDYFFWHYRDNVHGLSTQFWWDDIRPLIIRYREL